MKIYLFSWIKAIIYILIVVYLPLYESLKSLLICWNWCFLIYSTVMIFVLFFRTIVPFCIVYFFFWFVWNITIRHSCCWTPWSHTTSAYYNPSEGNKETHNMRMSWRRFPIFFFFFFFFFAIAFNAKSFVIAILGFFSFSSPFLEGLAEAF